MQPEKIEQPKTQSIQNKEDKQQKDAQKIQKIVKQQQSKQEIQQQQQIHDMQKKCKNDSEQYKKILEELTQFGFEQRIIKRALQLTMDKQKAAQIIVKILEQGQDVDLSQYKPKRQKKQKPEKLKINRPKMLFVVNGELKMGKGKICAQVGHAVIGAYLQIQEISKYDQQAKLVLESWQYSGCAKIVVKAQNLKQMMEVKKLLDEKKINNYLVEDAGHTQIKAGSKTVLGIGPAFSNQLDPITEHLKLL